MRPYLVILFGIFAAFPLVDQQVEYANGGSLIQEMLIFPTFIGPLCVRSNALKMALNRLFTSGLEQIYPPSPIEENRQLLLHVGASFKEKISELQDDIRDRLFQSVSAQVNQNEMALVP